jgi:exopolysaccharide biosynthesis polyprenyl glycosylphosphotransferase
MSAAAEEIAGLDRGAAAPRPIATVLVGRVAGLLALADLVLVSALGIALEPAGQGQRAELAAVLLSGPLLCLALLAAGAYRERVLEVAARSLLALALMLALVVAAVTALRLATAPSGTVLFEAALLWLAAAFACLGAARVALARGAPPGAVAAGRPIVLLADVDEADPSMAAPTAGCTRHLVRVQQAAAGLERTRDQLARLDPEEVRVTAALLASLDGDEARRRRMLDLLLALHGPVRLVLPGGSREPVVLARLTDPPLNAVDRALKRAVDLLVGGALLVLTAPLLALIALAVKLDSPGPVLFRQPRLGLNGRVFEILKFRSMHAAAADLGGRRLTARRDPRVTRVGALLRRTSLDELPQLVNVLRGEMSLVGPRPHPLEAIAGGRAYEEVVADIARRLRVPPGITGLAQVEGWRGNTATERELVERVRLDLEYIERWSIWLDLEILLRTPLASLFSRNAY